MPRVKPGMEGLESVGSGFLRICRVPRTHVKHLLPYFIKASPLSPIITYRARVSIFLLPISSFISISRIVPISSMLPILDGADDFCQPRLSNGFFSCLVPLPKYNHAPKSNQIVSYHHHPYHQRLALTVLKLDASSFTIEVDKTGTVRDLKQAVEAAFRYLPKKGPQSVSWEHVWGQFCLFHEGQKLLNDHDYLGMIGIKDGDQLTFIHHASYCHQLVKAQPITEDPDSDDECDNSHGSWDKHQNNNKDDDMRLGISEANRDKHDGLVISRCDYKLTHMLRGWLSYKKLGYQTGIDERISTPRFSNNIMLSLKNRLRFSSNKHCWFRRETLKGE